MSTSPVTEVCCNPVATKGPQPKANMLGIGIPPYRFGETHTLYTLLASYPVAVGKLKQKQFQGGKAYCSSQFKITQSVVEGESRQQELEAT